MKHNALNLYKHFCEQVENPTGVDSLERNLARSNAVKAKADLEHRFKTAAKYKDDPEIKGLFSKTTTKKVSKEENGSR